MSLFNTSRQTYKTVYPFQPITNVHTTALLPTYGTYSGQIQPGLPFYCLETDNNANAKYVYIEMPPQGQNPNISTQWECWFKLSVATQQIFFIIGNQQTLQVANASIRGYALFADGLNSIIGIVRIDGGGVTVVVHSQAWTGDVNLHHVKFSREVSGANRFWRTYYDNMSTAILGPTNDATYTNFSYWGWDYLTGARVITGGEACQS